MFNRRVIKPFREDGQSYVRGARYRTVNQNRIKKLVAKGYLEDKEGSSLKQAQDEFKEKHEKKTGQKSKA